jgi:hypothetical protein
VSAIHPLLRSQWRLDRSGDLQGRPGPIRPHHLLWPLRQQPTASTPRLFKSEHILPPTPRTGRRWHPGPAEVPIDRSGLAAELSTSAVTVKVEKRSASGPDTAGASGPGLAPPPGAARSIRFARAAHRARVPPPRAAADHQGLVERAGPTELGQPYQRQVQTMSRSTIQLHTAGRPTPRQWAGRRWRRTVLVRPCRRPLAGPPGAPGGSRE